MSASEKITSRLSSPLRWSAAILVTALLGACASTPTGPTVQVYPPPNKSFDRFQEEKAYCMQYAQSQVTNQVSGANTRTGEYAAIGTVAGAALGAVVGQSTGAGVGAALGAAAGTALGTDGKNPQNSTQDIYNMNYAQCMYAKGNTIGG